MRFKRIAAVLFAAALLFASGCNKKKDGASFTGIAQTFVCNIQITCLGQKFSAGISRIAKTVYEYTFVNSDGREILVFLSGDGITMKHGQINYTTELNSIPLAAPFVRLSNTLDACDGADSYGKVTLEDGIYKIESETEYGAFTVLVDADSLLPLKLNVPSADLCVEFTVAG